MSGPNQQKTVWPFPPTRYVHRFEVVDEGKERTKQTFIICESKKDEGEIMYIPLKDIDPKLLKSVELQQMVQSFTQYIDTWAGVMTYDADRLGSYVTIQGTIQQDDKKGSYSLELQYSGLCGPDPYDLLDQINKSNDINQFKNLVCLYTRQFAIAQNKSLS